MTAQEAIAYIENYTWSTTRLGLDRTRELLYKLGDPQKRLKFVHVAGSTLSLDSYPLIRHHIVLQAIPPLVGGHHYLFRI